MKVVNLFNNSDLLINQKILVEEIKGLSFNQENSFHGLKFKDTSKVTMSFIKEILGKNPNKSVIHFCSEKYLEDISINYMAMISNQTIQDLKNKSYKPKVLNNKEQSFLKRINIIPVSKEDSWGSISVIEIENILSSLSLENQSVICFFDGVEGVIDSSVSLKIKRALSDNSQDVIYFNNSKNNKQEYSVNKKNDIVSINNKGKTHSFYLDKSNNLKKAHGVNESEGSFKEVEKEEFNLFNKYYPYWNYMISGLGSSNIHTSILYKQISKRKLDETELCMVLNEGDKNNFLKLLPHNKIEINKDTKINILDFLKYKKEQLDKTKDIQYETTQEELSFLMKTMCQELNLNYQIEKELISEFIKDPFSFVNKIKKDSNYTEELNQLKSLFFNKDNKFNMDSFINSNINIFSFCKSKDKDFKKDSMYEIILNLIKQKMYFVKNKAKIVSLIDPDVHSLKSIELQVLLTQARRNGYSCILELPHEKTKYILPRSRGNIAYHFHNKVSYCQDASSFDFLENDEIFSENNKILSSSGRKWIQYNRITEEESYFVFNMSQTEYRTLPWSKEDDIIFDFCKFGDNIITNMEMVNQLYENKNKNVYNKLIQEGYENKANEFKK